MVTTNLCLKRIRSRRTHERLLKQRFPQPSAEERPRAEDGAVVAQMLESMPEELAMVTVYYHLDGMSHAEIAELMRCSRRHIGDLLERAREFVDRAEKVAS